MIIINLSIILMSIGVGGIVAGGLNHIVTILWEAWKSGLKKEVLFTLAHLIPMIFIAITVILFVIYKGTR